MIDLLVLVMIRLFCGPHVTFVSDLNDSKPRILFANHNSLFDFLVIWASLPTRQREITRPAAARDYWTANPWRYFLAVHLFKAVLIERRHPTQDNNPLDDMLAVLDRERSLIIFPEGTRATGEGIGPFQAGLYHLCRARPHIEAVPIYLANLNRILPKGEFLPLPILSRVTFGVPLRLEDGESRGDFLVRAQLAVAKLEEV